jgi:hypothetical protein
MRSSRREGGLRGKMRSVLLVAAAALILAVGLQCAAEDVIVVRGPTLIAFFPQVSEQQAEAMPDLVEMLDDFHFHLNSAGEMLRAAGVSIHVRPAGEIRILDGDRVRVLAPPPDGSAIGYYMVAPGREPSLVLGVYTDVDLIEAAGRHLGLGASRHDAIGEDIPYTVRDGALHVFGHVLRPKFEIKLATSPEDDDTSTISFPRSDDGRWVVIEHSRDVNSIEFWLYDSHTGDRPARIPVGSGRHGDVQWHGDEVFEIKFAGMGYTISEFVHVAQPEKPFHVSDLLYCDAAERVYVSFYNDGVEIGRLFEEDDQLKERFPINLEYVSVVDAVMTIEEVEIEGAVLIVAHSRKDGSVARESFLPRILQR